MNLTWTASGGALREACKSSSLGEMAEFDEILDIEQLIDKVHEGFVVLYSALMTLEVNGVLNDSNSRVTMTNCRTIDGVDTWDEIWALCGVDRGVELLYQANYQRGTMEWAGAAYRPLWVDRRLDPACGR